MGTALPFRVRKNRTLFIAAGIFVTAALMLSFVSMRGTVPHIAAPETITRTPTLVMAAARPIESGTILGPKDIRAEQVAGKVPPEAVFSDDAALGHIAAKDFAAGEMLRSSALRDAASVGIAGRVAQGQRAFSMRVAEDEIVGGFLQSGDHVDVFATIPGSAFPAKNAQDLPDRSQAVLLLQNVLVLAVGETLSPNGAVQSSARTVSLSLTPAQLSRLALAMRFGKTSLAIRNPSDSSVADSAPVSLTDIAPLPAMAAAAKPVRRAVAGIPFYAGTRRIVAQWSRSP